MKTFYYDFFQNLNYGFIKFHTHGTKISIWFIHILETNDFGHIVKSCQKKIQSKILQIMLLKTFNLSWCISRYGRLDCSGWTLNIINYFRVRRDDKVHILNFNFRFLPYLFSDDGTLELVCLESSFRFHLGFLDF